MDALLRRGATPTVQRAVLWRRPPPSRLLGPFFAWHSSRPVLVWAFPARVHGAARGLALGIVGMPSSKRLLVMSTGTTNLVDITIPAVALRLADEMHPVQPGGGGGFSAGRLPWARLPPRQKPTIAVPPVNKNAKKITPPWDSSSVQKHRPCRAIGQLALGLLRVFMDKEEAWEATGTVCSSVQSLHLVIPDICLRLRARESSRYAIPASRRTPPSPVSAVASHKIQRDGSSTTFGIHACTHFDSVPPSLTSRTHPSCGNISDMASRTLIARSGCLHWPQCH